MNAEPHTALEYGGKAVVQDDNQLEGRAVTISADAQA
jgi:hypothetical protein